MTMNIAGDHRIVFVRLNPRRYDDVAIAAIGHGLQHAVEVFSDRTVRSGAEMYFLFRRIGSLVNGSAFETHAATREGNAILAELRRAPGN